MQRWIWGAGGILVLVAVLVLLFISNGQLSDLEDEKDALQSDYNTLQQQYSTLSTQNIALNGQLDQAQLDIDALQANYDATSQELADIQAVYPPREFSSISELDSWLAQNGISELTDTASVEEWYAKALQLQQDALADGFLISVDIDYDPTTDSYSVWCVAIIDSDIWYWDPELDNTYFYFSIAPYW